MILEVDRSAQELTRARPFIFTGESSVTCKVPSGPTQDLNVMTRRDACIAELDIVDILRSTETRIRTRGTHLLVVLDGDVGVSDATLNKERRLQRFDSIYIENETEVVLDGAGMVASISIDRIVPAAPH